jgi:hypothetical protein
MELLNLVQDGLNSEGPAGWSGQSGKELVLAKLFLHPDMERQANGSRPL